MNNNNWVGITKAQLNLIEDLPDETQAWIIYNLILYILFDEKINTGDEMSDALVKSLIQMCV